MTTNSSPKYSLAERDRRWNLARQLMDSEGVDALIVYGEHEDNGPAPFNWDTWFTNGRPGSTIVMPKSGEPFELTAYHLFICDHSMAARADNDFWIKPENMRLGRTSGILISVLKGLGLEGSSIGVLGLDACPPWHMEGLMPFQLWEKVLKELPGARFHSISDSFMRMVMVLGEEEELAMLRHSATIGEEMTQAMVKAAKIGNSETDVYDAASRIAHRYGTVAPGMHLFVAGENAASGPPQWTYRPHSPRILQGGDTVHSEVFCTYGQKHTQHQLSIAIGSVHPDIEKAGQVARECYVAGLEAIKPNATFGQVCDAMLVPVEEAGGWTRGPQIHSLNPLNALCGISKPLVEKWNEIYVPEGYPIRETMGHVMGDLVLKEGMSFAFEPSCGFGKHLVTVGGTVVVGKEGAVELNSLATRMVKVTG